MALRKYVLAFVLALIGSATVHTIHNNMEEMYAEKEMSKESNNSLEYRMDATEFSLVSDLSNVGVSI